MTYSLTRTVASNTVANDMTENDPIPFADETRATQPRRADLPCDLDVVIEESAPPPSPSFRRTSFVADLALSLVFFIEPGSLLSIAIVWLFNAVMMSLLWLGSRVFSWSKMFILNIGLLFAAMFVFGWLSSYYMRLISAVADNEDELPQTLSDGPFETIIKPILMFVGTWICLLAPAIAMIYMKNSLGLSVPGVWIWGALTLACFMWPMAVLCVSMGGLAVFARVDLMIYSVIRTFWAYTVVWICLAVTIFGCYHLYVFAAAGGSKGGPLLARHPLAGFAVMSLVVTYGSIIAMRIIGLYYRHFKHRFAWSWE